MAGQRFKFRTAAALVGLVTAFGAQAQITKCVDARGNVTYTDSAEGSCRNAVVMDIRETVPVVTPTPLSDSANDSQATRSALLFMTGVAMPVVRMSAWASLPLQQRVSPDARTVSMARQALSETDRALASMRTQKIASSR